MHVYKANRKYGMIEDLQEVFDATKAERKKCETWAVGLCTLYMIVFFAGMFLVHPFSFLGTLWYAFRGMHFTQRTNILTRKMMELNDEYALRLGGNQEEHF